MDANIGYCCVRSSLSVECRIPAIAVKNSCISFAGNIAAKSVRTFPLPNHEFENSARHRPHTRTRYEQTHSYPHRLTCHVTSMENDEYYSSSSLQFYVCIGARYPLLRVAFSSSSSSFRDVLLLLSFVLMLVAWWRILDTFDLTWTGLWLFGYERCEKMNDNAWTRNSEQLEVNVFSIFLSHDLYWFDLSVKTNHISKQNKNKITKSARKMQLRTYLERRSIDRNLFTGRNKNPKG